MALSQLLGAGNGPLFNRVRRARSGWTICSRHGRQASSSSLISEGGQQDAMPDRREGDHEKHHDIDAGLVLQPEAGVGDPWLGIDVQGECPAVSLEGETGTVS